MTKPKFMVCKIECTSDWDEAIVTKAGKIYGIYFYDENRVTYCCSSTANYELHFLESIPCSYPKDEFELDALLSDLEDGDNETFRNNSDLVYISCSEIDSLPKDCKDLYSTDWEITTDQYEDEKSYRELLSDAVNEYSANPNF